MGKWRTKYRGGSGEPSSSCYESSACRHLLAHSQAQKLVPGRKLCQSGKALFFLVTPTSTKNLFLVVFAQFQKMLTDESKCLFLQYVSKIDRFHLSTTCWHSSRNSRSNMALKHSSSGSLGTIWWASEQKVGWSGLGEWMNDKMALKQSSSGSLGTTALWQHFWG